jgi:hypothetical protein
VSWNIGRRLHRYDNLLPQTSGLDLMQNDLFRLSISNYCAMPKEQPTLMPEASPSDGYAASKRQGALHARTCGYIIHNGYAGCYSGMR